jgi:DNA-binding XRE family transcriptional regulator
MASQESERIITLGERIRNKRIRLGHSQQKMADILGVHRQTLNYWENGKVAPGGQTVQRVMEWLLEPTIVEEQFEDMNYWRTRAQAAEDAIEKLTHTLVLYQRSRIRSSRNGPAVSRKR